MATKTFTKGKAVRFDWETLKAHWGYLILVFAIAALVKNVPYLTQIMGEFANLDAIYILVINVVILLIGAVISMGLIKIVLKFYDGGATKFADLFSSFPLLLKYILASIFYSLLVKVGAYSTSQVANNVCAVGDYVYVTNGTDGLAIVDVSNPYKPLQAGVYRPRWW